MKLHVESPFENHSRFYTLETSAVQDLLLGLLVATKLIVDGLMLLANPWNCGR